MLDRAYRARFLARATLDAVIDVRAGRLTIDDLIDAGWTDLDTPANPRARIIVYFDDNAYLLAFPLPHVDREKPSCPLNMGLRFQY